MLQVVAETNAPVAAEEVRSEETPLRRGSPLPWLLLFFTVLVGLGIFVMARNRFAEQRQKVADALKADDEIHGRLKAAWSDLQEAEVKTQAAENKVKELELRVKELETQNQSMTDELDKYKKKPGKR
jgi:uncharacterized protein HemX